MFIVIVVLLLATAVSLNGAKPIPTISEQFILKTTEVDNGNVIVRQTLIWDVKNQRSHMIADGQLAHGHLEEITRCDVGWTSGYGLILGGPPGTNVSSWECKNRTLNPSPSTCQWSPFFDFPANATYVGKEEITWHNGTTVSCDAWTYWAMNQQYKFSTLFDKAVPARSSLIYTANPSAHLYHIDFTDFSAGSPPLVDFNPPKGIHCPNATDYEQHVVAQSTTTTNVHNVHSLLLLLKF